MSDFKYFSLTERRSVQERGRVLALVRRGPVLQVQLPQGVDRTELHRKGKEKSKGQNVTKIETLFTNKANIKPVDL